jgi:hypothetical protein
MAISNEHNLNAPLPAATPWGIRVRLRARDPFTRLVGADWQKLHWFASERERDAALADMAARHPYSAGRPAVVYQRVSKAPCAESSADPAGSSHGAKQRRSD